MIDLPWWRKDVYGWPIETPINRPFKAFTRIVCQNIKKLFIWGRRRRIGQWTAVSLPLINKVMPDWSAKEFVSVQPMQGPHKEYYIEHVDRANPRVGYLDGYEDKHPEHGGCCREMWSRVYTPNGWVYEKDNAEAFKIALDKYYPLYKAEIKAEEAAWNKEHGISDDDFHFGMTIVCDSSKQRK